jgi:beta-glucosidase
LIFRALHVIENVHTNLKFIEKWVGNRIRMAIARSLLAVTLFLSGCSAPALQNGLKVQAASAAQANPSAWPSAQSPSAISSPQTEAEIAALLAKMTIEQKVGQMIQADISAITPADLSRYPLGSILAGGNSGPFGDERADAATWGRQVAAFREASRKSGAGVPILFGVDAVHGHSNVPGATIFPHNIGLGAANDPDLIERIGVVTGAEVAASGIEWTFAPTLAVPQDMRWGRTYEGYAADPVLVARYATAMTKGLQGALVAGRPLAQDRVAATAKHFLADGGTAEGKDQGDAKISESELIARHAQGYPASINAGALTVMASFSSWNGVKHHGNPSLLTDVLKTRMGFAGLVVGDWNGHGQVAGCTVTDCAASFNAGLDLAMAPDSWKGLFDSTLRDVRNGTIPMARIDDAVTRILRVKAKLGLLDATPVKRGAPSSLGSPEHLAVAREAVAKSLVLLKNNDSVLPLRPGSRVLVAGPGADNMAMQAGGWTISWQGSDTRAADFPNGQTIGKALLSAISDAGGQATVSTDGTWTSKPDVAFIVFGEQPYAEFQGDLSNLAYRAQSGEMELIARLKAQGIKVVSVFLSGRPLFTGAQINASDAFVAAWLPGTQGAGVADVLVARRDGTTARGFTGRLPFAWPANALSPITAPLFPAGYGLDYTRQSNLQPVNEVPGIDLVASASEDTYLTLGKVPSPWRLGQDSSVQSRAVDMLAQEDARQFIWADSGSIAIDGPPVGLMRQVDSGFELQLDWRIDAYPGGTVDIGFAGGSLSIADHVQSTAIGSRLETRIPLTCFRGAGATFSTVSTPLRMTAAKGFVATIRNVRLVAKGKAVDCPPVSPK